MITYLALRLSNGDYYWGSTAMTLKKRERFHRKFKGNDHFHNSLKKYPDDWMFLEIFNEDTDDRETERKMLSLYYGSKGCLNLSNEPQGWGTGKNHARNKNPQYWEHLKGDNHPRNVNPEKWNNSIGDNHWTRKVDKSELKSLASNFPKMYGKDNPMNTPEIAKKLGMRPWICVAYSAPVAAASAVFLVYPFGQGSFSDAMPLGISGTFNYMLVFQAEHNILMHPFHMLGVAGVFGGSFAGAMHGSLVTSSLVRETTENDSQNYGYKFGQEEETYNICAAHGYFGRLIFQYASFNNSRSLHFFLAALPVIGIWFTALGVSTMAFNLNGLNFNQSILDHQGRVIPTWADILNRAGLGLEVVHERNAHNFPLDLAAASTTEVALTAPSIG
jgi:photosystem II P680 reaction center D1 protein